MKIMTYEEYLDEVTTLMTEHFDLSDEAAIKHVMRAQAADFFTLHDETPSMRTLERALQDANRIYEMRNASRPHVAPKRNSPRPAPDAAAPGKTAPAKTTPAKAANPARPAGAKRKPNKPLD